MNEPTGEIDYLFLYHQNLMLFSLYLIYYKVFFCREQIHFSQNDAGLPLSQIASRAPGVFSLTKPGADYGVNHEVASEFPLVIRLLYIEFQPILL
jgi:hypothetical protein